MMTRINRRKTCFTNLFKADYKGFIRLRSIFLSSLMFSRQNRPISATGITCKANQFVVEFQNAVPRRLLEILNPCRRIAQAFAFLDEDSKGILKKV